MSSLTFPHVTPEQYAALHTAATAAGIPINGQSGTVTAHGCEFSYSWIGYPGCKDAPLTIRLLHAPFMCGGIALGKIHDLVEQVLTPPVEPAETS